MKLVLFWSGTAGEILPGLLTERGVVGIAGAVKRSYTPQLTMQGIIDDFGALRRPSRISRCAATHSR